MIPLEVRKKKLLLLTFASKTSNVIELKDYMYTTEFVLEGIEEESRPSSPREGDKM